MTNLTKTFTLTTLLVLAAVLAGLGLASVTPAVSGGDMATPSMVVETRLGAAELDLCSGQAWPHFSAGCAAWIAASADRDGIDRSISFAVHDADHGFSIVGKAAPMEVAAR